MATGYALVPVQTPFAHLGICRYGLPEGFFAVSMDHHVRGWLTGAAAPAVPAVGALPYAS